MDNLSPAQRTRAMRANVSSGTYPEQKVRSLLRKSGFRYRSQSKGLPGTPDFVLTEYSLALFIHGCFWHMHRCQPRTLPRSNRLYWVQKLQKNVARDRLVKNQLNRRGWQTLTIWECQLKKLTGEEIVDKIKRKVSIRAR
jgi:DNA mismatch endonuclease, patch repair protein